MLGRWKFGEASSIITKPKEELKVFCSVFDVEEEVQKVAGGARLDGVGWSAKTSTVKHIECSKVLQGRCHC